VALKFKLLTRPTMRKLEEGFTLHEHGIIFERLSNGDGRFTINVMVDGERIHRVLGRESEGVTREQAENFIQTVRSEARQGRLNLPKSRKLTLSFRNAAEQYIRKLIESDGKDIVSKGSRLKHHLVPFFKDKPIAKLSTFDVDRYKKYRKDDSASDGTINRELAVLSHLFSKSIEWGWLSHKQIVIKKFKETSSRITYLTEQQINRLLDAAYHDQSSVVYRFILIGLGTSMRRSEILSVKIQDIDLDRMMIHIPKAKAGTREQPITSSLAIYLESVIENAVPGQVWLFPSDKSQTGHTVNMEKAWRRIVEAAGLDVTQVVRHTLRHTAITHLVQSGVDLPTVKRISGHKTLAMVERYSHQNGEHIQVAMDKLEHRYKAQNE
jgi:integrase